jgi:hypothetical protein
MSTRRTQKARPTFETLERRETPTAMAGAAAVAHQVAEMAVHSAAVTSVLKGSGHVTLTKQTPLNNGGLFAIGRITGQASPIGSFIGVENVLFTPGLKAFRANVVLQTPDGSRLVLVVLSHTNNGSTATGTYKIVAGTKRLAHATGSGVVNGTLSLATASLNFNFRGTLTV